VAVSQQTIVYFSKKSGKANHQIGTGFFLHNTIISSVKRVELITDRLSCVTEIGHWSGIVLNVHALSEDESGNKKVRFKKNWSMYWISSHSTTSLKK